MSDIEYIASPGWQDRFIPDDFKFCDRILNRSRLSVTLFVINIIVLAVTGLGLWYFDKYQQIDNFYIISPLVIVAFYSLIAYFFYFRRLFLFALHLFIASIFFPVFSNVLITALEGRSIGFILLPLVVVAFNLGGKYVGYFWAFVAGCMQIILFAAYYGEYESLGDRYSQLGIGNIYSGLHVCFLMIASIVAYDGIIGKMLDRQRKEREIFQFMAHHDSLTHLSNDLSFEAYHLALIRKNIPFSLIYIDMDNFKTVNDSFGHNAGDYVLRTIADRLQNSVRSADMAARLGGDEFAVLFASMAEEEQLNKRIHAIKQAISAPVKIGAVSYIPSASLGYAIYPQDGADFNALVDAADSSMYGNKRQSRLA
jgi:diguanylate cyclase (GGDEF)-like protein